MDEKKLSKDMAVHNIIIESREKISISGVSNVESFNEEKIIMDTSEGTLTLEGENLQINSLSVDEGEMSIEGYVYSVIYNDGQGNNVGGGLFARLFR